MPMTLRRNRSSRALPDAGVGARKSTNLFLTAGLVAEARELGVNVSQAAEAGIAQAVSRHRQARWLAENSDALDSSNAFVEREGLPLARHRNF